MMDQCFVCIMEKTLNVNRPFVCLQELHMVPLTLFPPDFNRGLLLVTKHLSLCGTSIVTSVKDLSTSSTLDDS